ncbi:MAG: serine/threonine protein kinase [Akkermansiaceae bacterium]
MNSSASEESSTSEQTALRLDPFVSFLYEEGNPESSKLENENFSQTPLYDTLRGLSKRYTEHTLIAEGGMKAIFRALDRRTSRYVAIARPLENLGADYYDAFLREAHITARLEHPGIIKLFGMDVDVEGRPFFTMEFKTGRSLRKIISDYKKGKELEHWPLSQRLAIILRVCESLSYAHSQRILHLDIKPENIQVGSFGEVQLCDWGMGVVIQGEENNHSETLLDPDLYGSLQHKIKGTPLYMAPELFDAKNKKTIQMDIYALGCLVDELIRAEPEKSNTTLHLSPDSPLNGVVEKAKAKRPSDRYASVSEIQRDISKFLEGYRMSVEQRSLRRELSLFYQRQRLACNITLASLLTLIIATYLFLDGLNSSRNEAQQSRDLALASLIALREEKAQTETRLKQQVKTAQLGVSDLIHLQITDSLNMELLVAKLHEQSDAVIANEPDDDSEIWLQKFWLHFLTQRFDLAVQLYNEGKSTSYDLLPLAKKYRAKLGDAEYLSTDDLNELVVELFTIKDSYRKPLAYKMVLYDLKYPRTSEDRHKILYQMMKVLNPNWKEQVFLYSIEDSSLKLSGKGLTNLSKNKNHISVIKIIDPRKLDLRGAHTYNLDSLKSLNLIEIDLRQTPIKSLSPLIEMRSLRRVIVSPGQFSKAEIDQLPSSIEVVLAK